MLGLRLIVITTDLDRLRSALTIAASHAALGNMVAMLFQDDAVAMLRAPLASPTDARHAEAGLPVLAALLEDALALGVTIVACQSGMALAEMTMDDIDHRIVAGGPVSFLQETGDDARLLII